MNKLLSFALYLSISTILVVLPSINMSSLMNGTQSSKTFMFLWGIGTVSIVAVIRFWIGLRNEKNNWSAIDLLFFLFILYLLSQNNWRELSHSLLFLELIGLAILYIIIRQQSTQKYFWILIGLSVGGLVQAIYGNLQLWGYFPSHHGLFKMTGSFFNPGPYSGYLAAVFPISLGLYLFNVSFDWQNSFILKLKQNFSKMLSFLRRATTKSHFFYNNSREKSSAVEQESSTNPTGYINMKSFLLVSIISLSLVLPASRSRAAWLAIVVSSVYLLLIKYKLFQLAKTHFKTRVRRVSLLVSLVVLLVIVCAGLYHFKKGSADGRLLIWKIGMEMINDKPILGHGYDGFKKHYMDYQAEYFENHPESQEAFVAGDTNYAFNELIQLTVEYGLVGILMLFALLFFLFFGRTKALRFDEPEEKPVVEQADPERYLVYISRAVILSILVFGLFSYPLQILPIKICLVVALAIFAGIAGRNPNINFPIPIPLNRSFRFATRSIVSIGLLGLLTTSIIQVKLLETAYSDWKNAFDLYSIGLYNECLVEYGEAYPILESDGDFLTNYGKALSMAEKHEKAITVLTGASQYYPNIVVYTALGDSYRKLKQPEQAEQAYRHAWNMNPSRFYPKYLLAKLYDETGQKEKAVEVAKEILEKDIKVKSTAIEEIKQEMRKIIEKNDIEEFSERKMHINNNLCPAYKTKEGAYRSVVLTAKFMLQKW